MFRLSKEEISNLRSQFVTSSWGGSRYQPFAFTEQGVAMLSSVLNSERAIQVNIAIMRAFVNLRRFIETHKDPASKIAELESKVSTHDENIQMIFTAIEHLMEVKEEPVKPRKQIGYMQEKNDND